MEKRKIDESDVTAYTAYLKRIERSNNTIEKYHRDVLSFARWLNNRSVECENVVEWKHHLLRKGYTPATINSMLIAINRFFVFMGWDECRVKVLKLQKKLFREESRDLTKDEYARLVGTAIKVGKERLALLMETICATGIRVSEVQYITVEAAQQGRTEISLKGKIRTILLPGKLCKKLLKYAKKPSPVRYFSPETERDSPENRSGQR